MAGDGKTTEGRDLTLGQDMSFRTSLATIIIGLICVSWGCKGESGGTQIVEMTTGSYKTVADGRAEIWVGVFDSRWREDLGRLADTVEVEIRCGEDRRVVPVAADQPTETVCGIQLQLEEITTWRPPQAKIKVAWQDR